MNNKLNNKGFTLVELLAVLAILIAIMAIAIPSISSSLERTKAKQNESRKKIITSAAELYVADHKNAIYKNLENNGTDSCYILISDINYLTEDEMKDADDKDLSGNYVIFTKPNSYIFSENNAGASLKCYQYVHKYSDVIASNGTIKFAPDLNTAFDRYFSSEYSFDENTGKYTLGGVFGNSTPFGVDDVENSATNIDTDPQFYTTYKYTCADQSGGIETSLTCSQIFEITGCVDNNCDGANYTGKYHKAQ